MKIAVEGMDGVGKTTIAKKIADLNGFTYIEKPIQSLLNLDDETYIRIINNVCLLSDQRVKAWFFGLANIFPNDESENYIFDRFLISNYFWNGNNETKKIFECISDTFGVPDLTFILETSVENRLKRIEKRDKKDYDLIDKRKHIYGYDRIKECVDELNIPYVWINTDGKTQDEVIEECNQYVQNLINSSIDKSKIKTK